MHRKKPPLAYWFSELSVEIKLGNLSDSIVGLQTKLSQAGEAMRGVWTTPMVAPVSGFTGIIGQSRRKCSICSVFVPFSAVFGLMNWRSLTIVAGPGKRGEQLTKDGVSELAERASRSRMMASNFELMVFTKWLD
jgi:hypothetical protein